jgi:hypothetical protein
VRAELFGEHGLPRVKLEERQDLVFFGVGVDEGLTIDIPADILQGNGAGLEAGLLGGVADVSDGKVVFGGVLVLVGEFQRGKVDGLLQVGLDVFPLGDQAIVDGVELVCLVEDSGAGKAALQVFEPGPLDDGGFKQRGRGVGVVFKQLGTLAAGGAGPGNVEATVERGGLGVPGLLDVGYGFGRDAELAAASNWSTSAAVNW